MDKELNCKVVSVHSADTFRDGKERVCIRVHEADDAYRILRLPNVWGLKLNDCFTLKMED
jgi:hypothetical protein